MTALPVPQAGKTEADARTQRDKTTAHRLADRMTEQLKRGGLSFAEIIKAPGLRQRWAEDIAEAACWHTSASRSARTAGSLWIAEVYQPSTSCPNTTYRGNLFRTAMLQQCAIYPPTIVLLMAGKPSNPSILWLILTQTASPHRVYPSQFASATWNVVPQIASAFVENLERIYDSHSMASLQPAVFQTLFHYGGVPPGSPGLHQFSDIGLHHVMTLTAHKVEEYLLDHMAESERVEPAIVSCSAGTPSCFQVIGGTLRPA